MVTNSDFCIYVFILQTLCIDAHLLFSAYLSNEYRYPAPSCARHCSTLSCRGPLSGPLRCGPHQLALPGVLIVVRKLETVQRFCQDGRKHSELSRVARPLLAITFYLIRAMILTLGVAAVRARTLVLWCRENGPSSNASREDILKVWVKTEPNNGD